MPFREIFNYFASKCEYTELNWIGLVDTLGP